MRTGKSNAVAILRSEGYSYTELAELFGQPESSMRRLVAEATHPRRKNGPTHLVIPDTQAKPDVPLDHMYWAGKYTAEIKPDVVIHLGDAYDLPSLSSYEGRGSRYYEGKRLMLDVSVGNKSFEMYEKGLDGFQPKRKILLRGNHEDRFTRLLNEEPKLEGVITWDLFETPGWEVHDFLEPVEVDGMTYSHYFPQPLSGRPYGGAIETRIKNIGFSAFAGHEQGFRFGRLERGNGQVHVGVVAGSFYQHDEHYKGIQGNNHWRGIVVGHEVMAGDFQLMQVSLKYLESKFG